MRLHLVVQCDKAAQFKPDSRQFSQPDTVSTPTHALCSGMRLLLFQREHAKVTWHACSSMTPGMRGKVCSRTPRYTTLPHHYTSPCLQLHPSALEQARSPPGSGPVNQSRLLSAMIAPHFFTEANRARRTALLRQISFLSSTNRIIITSITSHGHLDWSAECHIHFKTRYPREIWSENVQDDRMTELQDRLRRTFVLVSLYNDHTSCP